MSQTMPLRKATYRRLGRSGLRVSVPIFGGMSLGSPEWVPWMLPKEQALPLLKAAYDRGINTIDTANVYANGEAEKIVAAFMKEYKIPREQFLIITKCSGLVTKEIGTLGYLQPQLAEQQEYVNQSGLSRAAIFNAVEASLQRLETSYIDLLLIHRYDPKTEIEEAMKALHDLVQSGKVRYIGACSMFAWQFSKMNHVAEKNGWTKFVCMQSEYSLLHREEEREMYPYCTSEGIGIIPYCPLSAGTLTRPVGKDTIRSEFLKSFTTDGKVEQDIVTRVEEIAKKKGWTMAQVATAWVTSKVTSPVVGISKISHIEEAIVNDMTLTEEETKYLEELYVPKKPRW